MLTVFYLAIVTTGHKPRDSENAAILFSMVSNVVPVLAVASKITAARNATLPTWPAIWYLTDHRGITSTKHADQINGA